MFANHVRISYLKKYNWAAMFELLKLEFRLVLLNQCHDCEVDDVADVADGDHVGSSGGD